MEQLNDLHSVQSSPVVGTEVGEVIIGVGEVSISVGERVKMIVGAE